MKSRCRKCELLKKKRLCIGNWHPTHFSTSNITFKWPWITNLYYDTAGGQEFGSSINLLPTRARGADYAHHITGCPPGFKNGISVILEPVFSSGLLIFSLHRKFSWTNYASYLIGISSRLSSHSLNTSGRYNSRFLCARWALNHFSKLSIIRPGRSRLLEFEKKIVLVV